MNILEKAQFIQELDTLIDALDHRALTLFETAKTKQRLKEIFEQCDEPFFQRQFLRYRSLSQPDLAADQFLQQTNYQLSYRGFFYYDDDLEQALYKWPESGWALLYERKKGWQVWFIPAKNRTALISDWGTLHDGYDWLEELLKTYPNLQTDEQVRQNIVLLEREVKTNYLKTAKPSTLISESVKEAETLPPPEMLSSPKTIQPHTKLKFADYQLQVVATDSLQAASLPPRRFTQVQIRGHETLQAFMHVYVQSTAIDFIECPIYVAEQVNRNGGFKRYIVWLGYTDNEQILQAQQNEWQEAGIILSSIKKCTKNDINEHWDSLESFYEYYLQQNEIIWQSSRHFSFIPSSMIQPQKFIHFDEMGAKTMTPILLLKERDRLRIIHGQRRLQLNPYELALPYVLFDREDGLTWQQIQFAIQDLPHPVDARELLHTLIASS